MGPQPLMGKGTYGELKPDPWPRGYKLEWGKQAHKLWAQYFWGSLVKMESLKGWRQYWERDYHWGTGLYLRLGRSMGQQRKLGESQAHGYDY